MTIFIILFSFIGLIIKSYEWKQKADKWDEYEQSKYSIYLPSIQELILLRKEKEWQENTRNAIKRSYSLIETLLSIRRYFVHLNNKSVSNTPLLKK